MFRKTTLVLFAVCLALGMMNAWGQAVGTLNGTILDAAGAVVPGAAVVVVNNDTKVENKTTSTSAGAYTIPYLPEGTYTIRVTSRLVVLDMVVVDAKGKVVKDLTKDDFKVEEAGQPQTVLNFEETGKHIPAPELAIESTAT